MFLEYTRHLKMVPFNSVYPVWHPIVDVHCRGEWYGAREKHILACRDGKARVKIYQNKTVVGHSTKRWEKE